MSARLPYGEESGDDSDTDSASDDTRSKACGIFYVVAMAICLIVIVFGLIFATYPNDIQSGVKALVCSPQPGCATCARGLTKMAGRRLSSRYLGRTESADCGEQGIKMKGGESVGEIAVTLRQVSADYENPLTDAYQQSANVVAEEILTEELVMGYMRSITSLPNSSKPSRMQLSPAIEDSKLFLQNTFKSLGLQTCLQDFQSEYNGLPYTGTNVIAYLPGSGGAVVLGAHYDSRAKGPLITPATAAGADDDGSGIAALLAVATAFSQERMKSVAKRPIYFVAFAAEELGLVGSKAFAEALANNPASLPADCKPSEGFLPHDKHSAVLMDMIGWKTPRYSLPAIEIETCDWSLDVLDDIVSASKNINEDSLAVGYLLNPFGSDHIPFIERGIPAILLIAADQLGYPAYHTEDDTISKIAPDLMVKATRMIFSGLFRQSKRS